MPIPSPKKGQSEKDFISECMSSETMNKEFPENKQRYAVCMSRLKEKELKASLVVETVFDKYIFTDEKTK